METVRPILHSDLEPLVQLAFTAHRGITSLPQNRKRLEKRLERSLEAFGSEIVSPGNQIYLFVLEDTTSHTILGTCALKSKTGHSAFYQKVTEERPKHSLHLLNPICYSSGPSELCGLFLSPEHRKAGLGRLLSHSRFLFLAAHPHRFDPILMAEMRGVIRSDGSSPFWDAVGSHFLDVDFSTALRLLDADEPILEQLTPQHPLYIELLPKTAQNVIGKTHRNTTPALNLLLNEGFLDSGEVDLFDAGPKLSAPCQSIHKIRSSCSAKITAIHASKGNNPMYLLANQKVNFRACLGHLEITGPGEASLNPNVAEALNIEEGDSIRYVRSHTA